ncbi:filamentous hemagglutinin N-terminal domain-containing protein [filamentous cyanobacterium LEGE 11480]|uniref:Filamentous hemagglutinin N-terminal domain-containing protein n=1 Tax=Romeriopsis navalis LEGE 11480 TaxID=2777977 RepID=A0A928VP79_9CYAN|nr:filamentous hemagglutinin N-terminal domain-containing protein [Romeriopsis navalis]MBE9031227.1 filamentous hemagglutinin N-terminal domain-containing protein [Romeriopsis navalis LEGE 11480]
MSTKWWNICALGLGWLGAAQVSMAQNVIVPDGTLGAERSTLTPAIIKGLPSDRIEGGAIRGSNLFHSFQQFNIGEGRGAYFANPVGIQNILTRVTGASRSQILGTLGGLSEANLFLINPNGIVFGADSRLDLGGSFVATTADALQFGDAGDFSASIPRTPSSLLTIQPSALLFNQLPVGVISNNSIADAGRDPSNSFSTFGLRVPDGRSLLLLGGNITSDGGGLVSFGGRIDLGGVMAIGTVGLNINNNVLSLNFPNGLARADVLLTNGAGFLATTGGGGGDIAINARNIDLSGDSGLNAGIGSNLGTTNSQSGDITLDATGNLTVSEGSRISNNIFSDGNGNSGDINIQASNLTIGGDSVISSSVFSGSNGNSGDINIQADNLTITEDSVISSSIFSGSNGNSGDINIQVQNLVVLQSQLNSLVFGVGNGGNIIIRASEFVELSGDKGRNGGPGGILAQIDQNGIGRGGDIFLETGRLSVSDGSKVQATTFGDGDAGNLFIRADEINLFNRPNVSRFFSTDINAGITRDQRFTGQPKGNGGNLTIEAKRLSIRDGAKLTVDTDGQGNAGSLFLKASDSVQVVGQNSSLSANVRSGAAGRGGNLTIETKQLSITDGGVLSASTFSSGNAGNVTIRASESIELSGDSGENGGPGGILAQVNENGRGRAGDIFLETNRLSVSDGSKVQAATFGNGDSGNIFIRADEIDLFNTPDVPNFFSTAINAGVTSDPRFIRQATGNGGKLTIEARRLSIRDGAEVTVDTSGKGGAGTLFIKSTDLVEVIGQNSFLTADVNSKATAVGNRGSLIVETEQLSIRDGGQVGSSTFGVGNAGDVFIRATDIDILGLAANGNSSSLRSESSQNATGNGGNLSINTRSLSLQAGALLTSQSEGQGSAGNITANISGLLKADNGTISTRAASFSGGTVNITAGNIRLSNDSDITTFVSSGIGGGGNITLTANSIIALNDSDILAFAQQGKGGNITFNTPAFFGQNYRPDTPPLFDGNNRVDINATGGVSGIITLPDTSFIQNSLSQLTSENINPDRLIAQTCLVRRDTDQQGRFYESGNTNLANAPTDVNSSTFATAQIQTSKQQISTNRPWKLGDPIIEPTGFYRMANNKLVMGRECRKDQN